MACCHVTVVESEATHAALSSDVDGIVDGFINPLTVGKTEGTRDGEPEGTRDGDSD